MTSGGPAPAGADEAADDGEVVEARPGGGADGGRTPADGGRNGDGGNGGGGGGNGGGGTGPGGRTGAAAAPGGPARHQVVTELALIIAGAVVLAVVLRLFVAQAFFIPSSSMVPQLKVGDRVVVSRLAYDLHDPRRGDVVVFDSPYPQPPDDASVPVRAMRSFLEAVGLRQQSTEEFIKRVIGLPGETVEGRDGKVYVDGKELVEPYLPEGVTTGAFPPREVQADELWVMGDNRGSSADSRSFGPIDVDTVVGRAILRVWPPQRAAFL